jgi:hypothetical protein
MTSAGRTASITSKTNFLLIDPKFKSFIAQLLKCA